LSYQRHFHRSEHWYVVGGEAVVSKNGEDIRLKAGQAVDLPAETWHRVQSRSGAHGLHRSADGRVLWRRRYRKTTTGEPDAPGVTLLRLIRGLLPQLRSRAGKREPSMPLAVSAQVFPVQAFQQCMERLVFSRSDALPFSPLERPEKPGVLARIHLRLRQGKQNTRLLVDVLGQKRHVLPSDRLHETLLIRLCMGVARSPAGYRNPCSLCFAAMVAARSFKARKSSSPGNPLQSTGSRTSTLRLGIMPARVSTVFPPQP